MLEVMKKHGLAWLLKNLCVDYILLKNIILYEFYILSNQILQIIKIVHLKINKYVRKRSREFYLKLNKIFIIFNKTDRYLNF
jgi:hypothetical protein